MCLCGEKILDKVKSFVKFKKVTKKKQIHGSRLLNELNVSLYEQLKQHKIYRNGKKLKILQKNKKQENDSVDSGQTISWININIDVNQYLKYLCSFIKTTDSNTADPVFISVQVRN